MKQTKGRNCSMDIIRCFALLNVIGIHFFLNSGFYEETVSGWLMYAMVLVRMFTRCCVPLFLILSGYLLRTRQPNCKYYSKIGKTLGIYVLCSVFCLIYRYTFLHQAPSPVGAVLDTLCYAAAPYSWYIEMYLGLFLLIPFLNVLYNNIASKKSKQLLILVLLILTALPTVANIFRATGMDWWIMPSSSSQYTQLVPAWWTGIYPITYYFIGCYLSEYPIKIRIRWCALAIALLNLAVGTFSFYRSRGAAFVWGPWEDWNSLLVTIQTVLVFTLLSKLNYDRIGFEMKRFLGKLSDWCLAAYLVSWIFDDFFYKILEEIQPNVQYRFFYMPIIVIVVYVCSLSLSAVINPIYGGIEKMVAKFYLKIQKNNSTISEKTVID